MEERQELAARLADAQTTLRFLREEVDALESDAETYQDLRAVDAILSMVRLRLLGRIRSV